jgi:RNA polymerase sigma-70 factor (ECF subfamily)
MEGQRRRHLSGSGSEGRGLVSAAIRGDADAVRMLWQESRRWVAAVLLAHKPRESELEDLLQDVAMTYVRTISKLRDETMFKPWLRTVAINAARAAGRDTRRRQQRMGWRVTGGEGQEEATAGIPTRPDQAPPGVTDLREQTGRLTTLAARLPDGYREPLILKCVKGMSYREIGRMMGLPETTVETRIARGRRMLRELAMADGVVAGANLGGEA